MLPGRLLFVSRSNGVKLWSIKFQQLQQTSAFGANTPSFHSCVKDDVTTALPCLFDSGGFANSRASAAPFIGGICRLEFGPILRPFCTGHTALDDKKSVHEGCLEEDSQEEVEDCVNTVLPSGEQCALQEAKQLLLGPDTVNTRRRQLRRTAPLLYDALSIIGERTLTHYSVVITADGQSFLFPLFNFPQPNEKGFPQEQVGDRQDSMKRRVSDTALTPVVSFKKLSSMAAVEPVEFRPDSLCETMLTKQFDFGVFGLALLLKNMKLASPTRVVITSDELDALAVYSKTGIVSLVIHSHSPNLPEHLINMLHDVVFWFGKSEDNQGPVKSFMRQLNRHTRCSIISQSQPTPFQAAKEGKDLKAIVSSARDMKAGDIATFTAFSAKVEKHLSGSEEASGAKWERFKFMNKILKGHRPGELTVLTGLTGCGKTTFLCEYSLDLCKQGVRTLWGSFEINNVRLASTMLTQFSRVNLPQNMHEYPHWSQEFSRLPMHFMTFQGSDHAPRILPAMEQAVCLWDIEHIVLDNLQFMVTIKDDRHFAEYFLRQDKIVSQLRKFATSMNCHVTLVIHPKKEDPKKLLSLASIYGGARASQEADNVLILQELQPEDNGQGETPHQLPRIDADGSFMQPRGLRFLEVAKNRYDGQRGKVLLTFDRHTLTYHVPRSFTSLRERVSNQQAETDRMLTHAAR